MKKNSRLVAFCGIFTALAMIFSYVEMLLPISIGVPGAKLGLANIAVLVVLYVAGGRTAFCVDILRIVLTSILFGNMAAFIFSISGGMLSIIVMILLKKSGRFSMLGVSVAGGTAHNIGQIAAAAVVVGTAILSSCAAYNRSYNGNCKWVRCQNNKNKLEKKRT